MNIAVLVAFIKEPREVVLITDRTTVTLDAIPRASWTLTALIPSSEADFEAVAEFAAKRPRVGVALFPDEATLWKDALKAAPPDADIIVTLDGATDWPEEIPTLLGALESPTVGVVVGVRRFPPAVPGGLEGKLLQTATGGAVRDLTSSFRAFRGPDVRKVSARAGGHEALLDVTATLVADGLEVAEVEVTTSAPSDPLPLKLGFSQFWRSFINPLAIAAVLVVLAGAGVFFLSTYPPHEYLADSDSIIAGVCAADVTEGRHWLFYPTGRVGPHVCYAGSVAVALFGQTRQALALFPILPVLVCLTFIYLSLKVALGRSAALVGTLAAAFPPMQYVLFIEPAFGYAEVMACTAITWWLGFQLLFRPWLRSKWMSLAFGLALGLNFWTSPQSLMLTLPLTLLLVVRRVFRSVADFALVGLGGVMGLWAFGVSLLQGVNPIANSFATRPVNNPEQLLSNAGYLFSTVLPLFFLNREMPVQDPVPTLNLILFLSALACICAIAGKALRNWSTERPGTPTGLTALFAIGLLAATFSIFSASSAGNFRIWLVRYIAPVFFAIPLIAATLYARARRNGNGIIVLLGVVIVSVLNVTSYRFTNDPDRILQTIALSNDQRMYRWLQSHNVNVILGDYWLVYKMNFGLGTGIRAIPVDLGIDVLGLRQRVSGKPMRLALTHTDKPSLSAWASKSGLRGHIEPMDGGHFAFLVDGEVDPKQIEALAALHR
ncbi:MAG: glycosyltransferase family 39 protein [Bryobacteraceae bacterium]|nr:glycosyltransferase family 39 protein [Bryobacteraceae bacterium]